MKRFKRESQFAHARRERHGAQDPRWRQDGRELLYICGVSTMAVEIAPGLEFKPGKPQRLGLPQINEAFESWDVSPNGKRILVAHSPESGKTAGSHGDNRHVQFYINF